MFFLTELYSEKHQAKLIIDVAIEIIWADSIDSNLNCILRPDSSENTITHIL